MANGFMAIPNWFSSENQGGDVTIADLNGDGQPELIVFQIDHRTPGPNGAFYQIGWHLDAQGHVTGGWSNWIEVPDWFAWENQGAGIAVADLSGNGRPDLIIFQIDNPVGQNQGYYRIGRDLDQNGNVTGGWTNWTPVPDWFSHENQDGSIAITSLENNQQNDLIVFMIDNPFGTNEGLYKIGRKLDSNGNVTGGWTNWIPVPGWFSSENQGAGVAVADLENSGLKDIVIFQIDNPPGRNQAFYKIGKNINASGNVTGGWSSWLGVPDWFSHENQGGGIATSDLNHNGKHELVIFMIDNPVGQNAGLLRFMELETDPQTQGKWELLSYDSEVLAVHAAVLPSGKVLFFAGSGNNVVRFRSPDFGNTDKRFWCSVVWDPKVIPAPSSDNNFSHPDTLRDSTGKPVDFFCGGDCFLPDGTLLSAGGTLRYDLDGGFQGRKDAILFDPQTEQWKPKASMAHGRWYPTLVSLGDGRILAVSGLSEHGDLNTSFEIYSTRDNKWQVLTSPPAHEFPGLPLYAHLFLLEDGMLFFTGGRMDDPSTLSPCLLDITKSPVQVTPIHGLHAADFRNQSASVLLPPAQDQKVMIIGGGPEDESNATDSVDIVNFKALHPAYQAAAPMQLPRMHLNAVLLPDRTVFVSGGALQREGKIAARLQAEIYNPATNRWRIVATASIPRMYHSIALLLPDGRVVAAGGNPDKGTQVGWEPPDRNEELKMEVFSPPYLFKGPRPLIGSTPTEWKYGQTVKINSPQAVNIRWASLIKNGVTTHSFNTGQRLVDLAIVSRDSSSIQVKVTQQKNIAPAGWYMLFLTDKSGVPSVAKWIHLTSA